MPVYTRTLSVMLVVVLTSGILSTLCAGQDHERAHKLLQQGKILPLEDIIKRLPLDAGRILEVELEDEDGRMVYEIEVLNVHGQVYEYLLDANNGELLGIEEDD